MIRRALAFTCVFILYCFLFVQQEQLTQKTFLHLPHPLPAAVQKIALGFVKQLGGEINLVTAKLFLGGVEPGRDPETYAPSLAEHFSVASQLNPLFKDTYYFCQSSLPHIAPEYAKEANKVLKRGIEALPDNPVLPFFVGFNYFYYLKQPKDAAVYLRKVSQMPGFGPWVGHLASILAAEGGDITAGLIWLKAMYASEKNELTRERYKKSIIVFEKAESVQKAIILYHKQNGNYPQTLEALVPGYLPALPDLDNQFKLSWKPPTLRLIRNIPQKVSSK